MFEHLPHVAVIRASLAALAVSLMFSGGPPLTAQQQPPHAKETAWQPLFDGKTLANWQSTRFIGEGAVRVADGQIIMEAGRNLTGITWTGSTLPSTNYEISLRAMRVEGGDFFAGVTFPVDDSFCSLILGGWGGTVVGLSSINGMDASENETTQSIAFERGRWYTVRVRVTPEKIEAWLDERQIIAQGIKGKKIDTRIEVEPSRPLGVASWRTTAAVRDIRLRRLEPRREVVGARGTIRRRT